MRCELGFALLALVAVVACTRTTEPQGTTSPSPRPRLATETRQSDAAPGVAAPAPIIQPSSSPGAPTRVLDTRADEVLRAMSTFMAATQRFAFEAEETYDELPGDEPRMLLSNVRRVVIERPRHRVGSKCR